MSAGNWKIWRERGSYILVALLIFYLSLLPIGIGIGASSIPDLLYCVSVAWVMRRPESLPLPLVAAVSLLADFILGKPLALWTIFMIIGTELFRGRETGKGIQMRLIEWTSVAALFAAMLIAYWLVLTFSFAARPIFADLLKHILTTAIAYPVVVAALYWIVNIRAPLPADRARSIGRVQ